MLSVDVDSGTDVLGTIQARVDDPQQALDRIAELFRARERALFASNGRGTWAANDADTIAQKGNGRVLVHRGVLQASLTRPTARYAVTRLTGDELILGTRNPVARLHRDGARGMPRRNPVPATTAAERQQWSSEILGYLVVGSTS